MTKKSVKAGTSKAAAAQRRALFVEAMLTNNGNKYQSAIAAGWPPGEAAKKAATRLSEDVRVSSELARRRNASLEKAQEKTDLTIDGVLRELHGIVHSDLRKCFDPDTGALLAPKDWPDEVARSMASIKVVEMAGEKGADGQPMYVKEIKFWDKNSAIEKAMKTLGMLIERHESGKPGDFGTKDEVRARIRERQVKLGLTKVIPGKAATH